MTTVLIVFGIIAGYIAAVPLFARAFYIMMANKPEAYHFHDGGHALGVASIWPLTLWVALFVWVAVDPVKPGRRRIRAWIESPTPAQRRADRQAAQQQPANDP